jgi:hypothetical protein
MIGVGWMQHAIEVPKQTKGQTFSLRHLGNAIFKRNVYIVINILDCRIIKGSNVTRGIAKRVKALGISNNGNVAIEATAVLPTRPIR